MNTYRLLDVSMRQAGWEDSLASERRWYRDDLGAVNHLRSVLSYSCEFCHSSLECRLQLSLVVFITNMSENLWCLINKKNTY